MVVAMEKGIRFRCQRRTRSDNGKEYEDGGGNDDREVQKMEEEEENEVAATERGQRPMSVVCNTQSGDGDNNFDLVRTDMSAAIVDAPLSQVLRDNNVRDDGDDDGNEEELDLM
ncbi:hypothetical protein LOK49_LG09G01492 [Camellia lanceoleosa]|uniref:Uncharacterized protein n=1 Tax=Camellia lanceoleosa TaxID=1840588 RepID=A0ACC0GLX7_9ERIC|nr:hypothetical protein LOK49_LG09G01492 [Camellia lanceoleosa]